MVKFHWLLLIFTIARCTPTGEVDDYDWRSGKQDILGGKSIFELMETPQDDMDIQYFGLSNDLELFDYPDSRNVDRRRYVYEYQSSVNRPRSEGRGISLTGLAYVNEGDNGVVLQEEYFEKIDDAGFDIIRIPVRFQSHFDSLDPVVISPEFLSRVDWAINEALERDFTVILDCHNIITSNELRNFTSAEEQQEFERVFLEIWRILSVRYKNYPDKLYFELMNAPHLPVSRDIWNSLLNRTLSEIRSSGGNNARRTVIVDSGTWGHLGALEYLDIPSVEEDPNIMVLFNYWEPLSFTQQGLDWSILTLVTSRWNGNVWSGTPQQKSFIDEDLRQAAEWAEAQNRRLIISDFGARQEADKDSRVRYLRYVRQQAEARDMVWIYWAFHGNDDKGLYDPAMKGWKIELLDALIPPSSE